MKWAFGIRRKISTALLLAAIFVLVFVKSLLDRQHVSELGNSFSSVYEDRLMVESYIYRLSEHLFRKKIIVDSTGSIAVARKVEPIFQAHNTAINDIISAYELTKLTPDETRFFQAFKGNVHKLMELEEAFFSRFSSGIEPVATRDTINAEFDKASENLGHLSRIQITEGRILNEQSQRIVAGSSLLGQFEMGILIAIGLLIIVLVFESTAVYRTPRQNESLN